jgi:hypothetical protein
MRLLRPRAGGPAAAGGAGGGDDERVDGSHLSGRAARAQCPGYPVIERVAAECTTFFRYFP